MPDRITVAFQLAGLPQSQGSQRAVNNRYTGKAQLIAGGSDDARDRLKLWRRAVAAKAREQRALAIDGWDWFQFVGPVSVEMTFRFPMPLSADVDDRQRGLRPMTVSPDMDKLERAVYDALSDPATGRGRPADASGLLRDDALIWNHRVRKIQVWHDWTGLDLAVSGRLYTDAPPAAPKPRTIRKRDNSLP